MELRELKAFTVLAEELHFRRAAERLQVSQPTVSTMIQHLESGLGTRLFERSSRSVSLTPAGRELLPKAHETLRAAGEMERLAERDRGDLSLTIGTLFGFGAPLVEQAVDDLRRSGHSIRIDIKATDWSDPAGGLFSGVDAAVLIGPTSRDSELIRIHLCDEERVAILPEDHPLSSANSVTLDQIDDLGWVVVGNGDDTWYRWWRLDHIRGGPPNERGSQLGSVNELMISIRNGGGICTTLASIQDLYSFAGLALVPLSDVPTVPMDLCVLKTADRARVDPLAGAMLSAAEAGWPSGTKVRGA